MFTPHGHLTYCTNIHAGESWPDHFKAIKENIPLVKQSISPEKPFGLGLRLSHIASVELIEPSNLTLFKAWLNENYVYVFTLNGFPYGGFHHTRVKDQVHAPDWTTRERVEYTKRLFSILKELLPEGMDGGQSTSPLSYRHWFKSPDLLHQATQKATDHVAEIALFLVHIFLKEGKILHLDIEPEPDGILETGTEFLNWYTQDFIPAGIKLLTKELSIGESKAVELLKQHIGLCYDVCHFAIGYEPHAEMILKMKEEGIRIGKIQISAALKGRMDMNDEKRNAVIAAFSQFNEPTYLHQVVAKTKQNQLIRYPDLPEALEDGLNPDVMEWRAHFHVPIAEKDFGLLQSTQDAIVEVIGIQKENPFTQHMEVETYTWEVLPEAVKLPLKDSIIREMKWAVGEVLSRK